MIKAQRHWDLNQWLYTLEHRHKEEIQLGLSRMVTVAKQLDLHSPACKVITVAGTNGKGSTVAALEKIYHTAGYQVGAYTSPHLLRFNERIRVNLEPIPDVVLCGIFYELEEAQEVALTYFEMATLAALYYFKHHNLDIILLEVGIGGRLDATNSIHPDLAIITTIDFDHQDYLGDTLDNIGYEKAGILREGIPFIYADSNPPNSILSLSKALKNRSFFYEKEYQLLEKDSTWDLHYHNKTISLLPKPKIQLQSAAAAIMASQLLNDFLPVTYEALYQAMSSISIPGRLQLQQGRISVLYDVSHNPQSARLLADTIKTMKKEKVHAVFSALNDKDLSGLILPLQPEVHHWYPAQLSSKRATSASVLLNTLKNKGIFVEICYNEPFKAFAAALNRAQTGDLIVVYGSFLTVGAVMAAQLHDSQAQEIQ